MRNVHLYCLRLLLALAFAAFASTGFGAPAKTGTVTGRVFDASSGQYLANVRVALQNTSSSALTDDFGTYRLEVPAGTAKLAVSYGGQKSEVAEIQVGSGETVTKNFMLGAQTVTEGEKGTIKLNEFVVQAERFQTGQEIAINEERNSINLQNVVSADAFGKIPEGNVGEFVKYLPGVLINYGGQAYTNGNDATAIQVRGFTPDLTAITVDGMPITSSQPGSLSRSVNLDMLSINNAARVELTKVPTPDMPADSPGGSVNLVSKNAFEYAKPVIDWSLYGSMNSEDTKLFKKEPGPVDKKTFHTLPGLDFTVADPITSNFGIAVTGASSNEFNENRRYQDSFTSDGSQTNLAGQKNYANNPFLSQIQVTDEPHNSFRQSASLRADWRPTPGQVLSFTYQLSFYNAVDSARRAILKAGKVTDWGPTYTIGKAGSGQNGSQTVTDLDSTGRTQYGQLRYTLSHGGWRVNAAYGHSVSNGSYKSAGNGHFSETDMDMNNVGQILFSNIVGGRVGSVSVLDKSGNPIQIGDINSYSISGLSSGTFTALAGLSYQKDTTNTYKIDIQRDLNFIPMSFMSIAAKVGFYRNQETQVKWGPGTGFGYQYVGPTAAFDVSQYVDSVYYNISPGYGFTRMQWADPYKVYKFYLANPSYFSSTSDDTTNGTSVAANNWNSYANQQIDVTNTKDDYYAEILGHAIDDRLGFIAGFREQGASISGYEPQGDKKWNYLRNPDGSVYTDSSYPGGVDITKAKAFADQALQARLAAKGITFDHVVNAGSLEAAKLQNQPYRPVSSHSTNKPAPSANLSFKITDKLVARFGWAQSYATPDYQSGNLSYGAVGRTSITDSPGNIPAGTISVSNPSLKPWSATNYDFGLAYYTATGGEFSVDYYVKFIKDFWISNSILLDDTNYAAVLTSVGMQPSQQYLNYQVNTSANGVGTGRTDGVEYAFSQSLAPLGSWGKPFYVFANFSTSKQSANQVANSGTTSNQYGAAGISFEWKRLTILAKATHQSKTSNAHFKSSYVDSTGVTQTFDIFQYAPAVTRLDLDASFRLTPHLSLFAESRNVTNTHLTMEQHDISGIWPAYARQYDTRDFGVQFDVGISGEF